MQEEIFEKTYELGIEEGFLTEELLAVDNLEEQITGKTKEELEEVLIKIYELFSY